MQYIIEQYYLSDEENLQVAIDYTGMDADEIETIVGRFAPHSNRAGQLRGELVIFADDTIAIRHQFSKKILWSNL